MNLEPMIIEVDNLKVTNSHIARVEKKECLNCGEPYDPARKITFVILEDGRVIWWHRQGFCKHKKRHE